MDPERYREVTTDEHRDWPSRYRDQRSRRAPRHVATRLNGTAVTWRHLIALLENGQREDGSVAVPEVLQAWGAPAELRVGARA